jgi:hypothetical protein
MPVIVQFYLSATLVPVCMNTNPDQITCVGRWVWHILYVHMVLKLSIKLNWTCKTHESFYTIFETGFWYLSSSCGCFSWSLLERWLLWTKWYRNIFTCGAELSVADTKRWLPRICNSAQMLRHESFHITFNQIMPICRSTRRHIAEDLIVVVVVVP